jgi:hypothetical protein
VHSAVDVEQTAETGNGLVVCAEWESALTQFGVVSAINGYPKGVVACIIVYRPSFGKPRRKDNYKCPKCIKAANGKVTCDYVTFK